MQNAIQLESAHKKLVAFPARVASAAQTSDTRMQFERMLIFVLFTLWAIGMVAWTLFSVVGLGHGTNSMSSAETLFSPTSLPTLQSATIFAVRLVLGI
jgi:hypothetical protein